MHRLSFRSVAWVAVLLVVGSWTGCKSSAPQVDSLTNWLTSCSSNSECGDAHCICGICTSYCDDDAECTREGVVGLCVPRSQEPLLSQCKDQDDLGVGGAASLCVPEDDANGATGGGTGAPDGGAGGGGSGGTDGTGGFGPMGSGRTVQLALGNEHTCALTDRGNVRCFGGNALGQLGQNNTTNLGDDPGELTNIAAINFGTDVIITAIASGVDHSCALEGATGRLWCWGDNASGKLGLGDVAPRGDDPGELDGTQPPVDLGTGVRAIGVVAGEHFTCALLEGGSVKCWGNNVLGQLGQGDSLPRGDGPGEMGDALLPIDLGTGRTVTSLHSLARAVCAQLDDGTLKCWGDNGLAQLGAGDGNNRGDDPGEMGDALLPVDLGAGTITRVATGGSHTCVELDGTTVKCFGWGGVGQLGQGATTSFGSTPAQMGANLPAVDIGGSITAIDAGGTHTCVVVDPDGFTCWGQNSFGQLGLGDIANRGVDAGTIPSLLPIIPVPSGKVITSLDAGPAHNCLLYDDGDFQCWGSSSMGQLGLGGVDPWGDDPGEDLMSLAVTALGD